MVGPPEVCSSEFSSHPPQTKKADKSSRWRLTFVELREVKSPRINGRLDRLLCFLFSRITDAFSGLLPVHPPWCCHSILYFCRILWFHFMTLSCQGGICTRRLFLFFITVPDSFPHCKCSARAFSTPNNEAVLCLAFSFKNAVWQQRVPVKTNCCSLCFSAPDLCLGTSSVPAAAPRDVAVEVFNTTVLRVSWTPVSPATVRGHLGGYKVSGRCSQDLSGKQ